MADEVITNLEEAAVVAVEVPVIIAADAVEGEAEKILPHLPLDQALGLAPVETAFSKVEREIETWFNDLRGNLQGLETETHNKLFAAKEALKARLTAIL